MGDIGQFPDERARASELLYPVLPVRLEDKLVVGLQLHGRAIVVHELHEPLRIGELLVSERNHGPFRPRVNLGNPCAAAIVLDLHHREEMLHFIRQRPEAVGKLG